MEGRPEPVCNQVRRQIRAVKMMKPPSAEVVYLSFSLMSQNRNRKSSGSDKNCGSFLSRHRSDARVALQQSPILQNDIDTIMKMDYNSKSELTLRSVLRSELLRPFTQLNEQTHLSNPLFLKYLYLYSYSLPSWPCEFDSHRPLFVCIRQEGTVSVYVCQN